MNVSYILFLLFVYLNSAYCRTSCPEKETVKNFNVTAFASGIWYDIARYPNPVETIVKCLSYEYKFVGDLIMIDRVNLTEEHPDYGVAYVKVLPDERLLFNFTVGNPRVTIEETASIVTADYDNYIIFYVCAEPGETQDIIEYVWIITRSPKLSSDVRAAIDKYLLTDKVIDQNRLIWIDYDTCDQN